MKESNYVTQIIAAVKEIGGKAIKFVETPFSEIGSPDIFICLRGVFIVIETKIGNNEASEIQKQRLREWAKAGAITLIVNGSLYPVELLIRFLQSGDAVDYVNYKDFKTWEEWQDYFEERIGWLKTYVDVGTSRTSN